MKLAISGKGGAGKTTLAGILAHYFMNDGYKVLAVDADPDSNLASAIGIPESQAASIKPISEQRKLIKQRTGASPRQFGQLFKLNPTVSDIPDKFSINYKDIKLLVLGAVQKGGNGCACPENVLLQSLLNEIILEREEVVIVDLEAGIEHLGRATSGAVDRMIIVVEPSFRSVNTAETIMKLAREIGIESFGIVGNKIQNEQQKSWITAQFPEEFILGMIPYHSVFLEADMEQQPLIELMEENLKAEFAKIFQRLKHGDALVS
ncbi:MAG: AAA family ATPase [Candidatus Latescibacteria bacterium]|nr:AAA family ATPase [Candidatus Latescibacterota bacterium]NIO57419.1 AAA family ATPase [Candidatus Latescibacterota bacterium]